MCVWLFLGTSVGIITEFLNCIFFYLFTKEESSNQERMVWDHAILRKLSSDLGYLIFFSHTLLNFIPKRVSYAYDSYCIWNILAIFGSQQPSSSGTWIDQEWIAICRFPFPKENQAIGRIWKDQEGVWLHSWLVVRSIIYNYFIFYELSFFYNDALVLKYTKTLSIICVCTMKNIS